ncbi:MAG: paraquat-inducible protein A [Verrucomicrobiales bacterium]
MKHPRFQTWPRASDRSHEMACHFCDTLHEVELIKEGERANCRTCGHILYENRPRSLERAVSFSLTTLILLTLTLLFPFLSLDVGGNRVSMSVVEAVQKLWQYDGSFAAASVALFVLIFPALQALLLLYLCVPLFAEKAWPHSLGLARLLFTIQPWVMLEVFFLGTLVSLLKLIKMADVSLGVGFWSLIGMTLCLAGALAGIDRIELWDRLEVATRRKST